MRDDASRFIGFYMTAFFPLGNGMQVHGRGRGNSKNRCLYPSHSYLLSVPFRPNGAEGTANWRMRKYLPKEVIIVERQRHMQCKIMEKGTAEDQE